MQKTITILGSTGSIGTQSIDVLRDYHEDVRVGFLTTNKRVELLAEQVKIVNPYGVAIADEQAYKRFKEISDFSGKILCGTEGVCEAAAWSENTIVLSALVGFSGVLPTLSAIEQGTTIALANKETLVSAGSVICKRANEKGVQIIAVDSEHSAILQCIVGEHHNSIEKLILTASGGPFRTWLLEDMKSITPEQALKHPNWDMGAKITIDSATLMNKGFEIIEAKWLFDIAVESIDVVVHPQSIIHSMVQFCDGSVKAQLGLPDMKLPIHYALTFPNRAVTNFERLDITSFSNLTFEKPDYQRFPCLQLAYTALEQGGTATAIVNAANEVAVQRFLKKEISFLDIPVCIEQTLQTMNAVSHPSLDEIIQADSQARALVSAFTHVEIYS